MEMLVEISGNEFIIEFNQEPTLDELKIKVLSLLEEAVLRGLAGQVPLLNTFNTKFNKWTQLHANQAMKDGMLVKVTFGTPVTVYAEQEKINPTTHQNLAVGVGQLGSLTDSDTLEVDYYLEKVDTGEGPVNVCQMSSDGSCLFAAIVHQINPRILRGDLAGEAAALRKQVVDHIKSNLAEYKFTIQNSIESSKLTYNQKSPKGKIDAFLRNLARGQEWGGYETLVACSRLKGREIRVLQEEWDGDMEAAATIVIDNPTSKAEPITIVYRMTQDPEALNLENPERNHYDSLHSFITESNTPKKNNASDHLVEKGGSFGGGAPISSNMPEKKNTSDHVEGGGLFGGTTPKNKNKKGKKRTLHHEYKSNSNLSSGNSTSPEKEKGKSNNSLGMDSSVSSDFSNPNSDIPLVSSTESGGTVYETEEELLEYYTAGAWEGFPIHFKKAEKKRWKMHSAKESKEASVVTPFQGRTPSSSRFHSKDSKQSNKRGRQVLSSTTESSSKGLDKSTSNPKKKQPKKNKKNKQHSQDGDKHTKGVKIVNSDDETGNNDSPTESSIKKKPKKKRPRKSRLPGLQITETNCLPELSSEAKISLERGQPDWRAIMPCFRSHVHGLIGKTYPTSGEYDIISRAFIKEYPCTADADNPQGFQYVRLKVRKSLSQNTYYHGTKREQKIAKLAAGKENEKPTVVVKEKSRQAITELEKELKERSDADVGRTKQLIGLTYQHRHDILSSNHRGVQGSIAIWITYPHLQSYQMLSYEYSLRLRLTTTTLHENMEITMTKLRQHYHIEESGKLRDIQILEQVFNDTTPILYRKIGMVTPLEIKDEDVARHGSGQDHEETHSPRVLVITRYSLLEERDVPIKSYLLGVGKVLNTCENPGAPEIALQLLAPYFFMSIAYPNSFKSFLRFLELNTNGGLCLQTLKQKPHDNYNKFMREFMQL